MATKTLLVPRLGALAAFHQADTIASYVEEHGTTATIGTLNWADTFPYRPLARVTAAHDGAGNLWLSFNTCCNYLRAVNYRDQSPVSEDSCVEVFLQPREGGEYWNFEFNCIGTLNASHRLRRPEPVRLGPDELAAVMRHPSVGRRPFCELEGLFEWSLLAGIPLRLMGMEPSDGPVEMRGNFYKCASACSAPHYLTWNPVQSEKPDFHRPECFGKIILL